MSKYRMAGAALLTLIIALPAWPEENLLPSRPSHPSKTSVVSLNAQTIGLSLSDAISLGLRNNRAIRSEYLDRIAQKFSLRVAEDSFTPKMVISSRYLSAQNQDDHYRQSDIAPATTLLTPYGTRVSLDWAVSNARYRKAGESSSDGASISVIQPLLRGAGKDIATAPVRLARLNEQVNRLSLKQTVMQTVTKIITAYHALLQAQEQENIARESLARTRQLVDVNRALILAGRMAEFEIVQTEADVAAQELALEDARNQRDIARLALLQLLALDLNTPVVASDSLKARRIDVDAEQALQQAEALQPGWLTQLIARDTAGINLAVASNNRLWDVSVIGGASQTRDRSDRAGTAKNWDTYVGIQVDIPLGDMSAHQDEVQAQVNVHTQALLLQETHQQLERNVIDAVRNIGAHWRQYEIAVRVYDLSRRKLDIEREKLAAGRSSNFQVLSFENDLRNAESSRLSTLINYLNAQAELDETLGTTLTSWDITLND